ncbi:MAG: calcium/sodium antiporter [Gammaproteobacteria bacterium]|nr:calcium/sodium antiporter [Gammaproteobacteria bacterium]MXY58138.1 calcium/sodium antiporter [Gammaproteobacteria bacterium]MYF30032.1 calcium/sodium antiporter [Gammaproteobacteria bacterium]MYK46308.1 calcium/sodium antiporter [Gammaproteobacteria bacterium]
MGLLDSLHALIAGYPFLTLIIGFITLGWSADRFVNASAAAAKNLGVSKIVIGLTAIAVGTSAPEIMVGIQSSLSDLGEIAIGNAIGSNIANMGLVLGITALVRPLPFTDTTLKHEMPWLIGATLLTLVCLFNLYLGVVDGLVLLGGLGAILYLLGRKNRATPADLDAELAELPDMTTQKSLAWFIVGLTVLLASAHVLVHAAEVVAVTFGVSELVVGLTIVAVGTSLPELSVTVAAARQGHPELAIGNVVGSNILNILAVLAIPALLDPQPIGVHVLWRDYGMMFALTALLVLLAFGIGSRKVITRFEGVVLLAAWIGYTFILYHQG